MARREGYFEVPRECTLTPVAVALDVDTSTGSDTIHRGGGRVIVTFLPDRA